MKIETDILFEDRHVLVCQKAAGMPVQTARVGSPDMVSTLKNYLAEGGNDPYLGLVHRLDQPVEGLLVFAKTPFAAKELSRQNTNGMIEKRYAAASAGSPSADSGILEDYLLKDGRSNCSKVVEKQAAGAKKAVLEYKVIGQEKGIFFFEIKLITGRHHQIRVQSARHGFPLLGDTKYNSKYQENRPEHPLALCAYSLKFNHPKTKENMHFKIKPSGSYFQGISL